MMVNLLNVVKSCTVDTVSLLMPLQKILYQS
jgi:hypothetical protein